MVVNRTSTVVFNCTTQTWPPEIIAQYETHQICNCGIWVQFSLPVSGSYYDYAIDLNVCHTVSNTYVFVNDVRRIAIVGKERCQFSRRVYASVRTIATQRVDLLQAQCMD